MGPFVGRNVLANSFLHQQAEPGYDNDPCAAKQRKRSYSQAMKDDDDDRALRHRHYLHRHCQNTKFGSWRPRKVYRVKAKHWLMSVDSQFQSVTGKPGLIMFRPDAESSAWSDPFTWPWVGIAMDLGSDGNCAYWALERMWKLNCDQYNDQSHGINCDHTLMLKSCGLHGLWCLMVVSWNMPHGPRRGDDLRMHQMRSCLKNLYESDPFQQPLYMANHRNILRCLARNGIALPGEKEAVVEAFEYLKDRAMFGKIGRRTTMARFAGAVYTCTKQVPMWEVDEFERTYCALEFDFLGNKGLSKLIIHGEARASVEDGEEGGQTGANRPTVDDAVLRSVACNAVAISQLLLSDRSNQRHCEILSLSARVLKEWHTEQNKEQRSAAGAKKWAVGQVQGGYMQMCASILSLVADADGLQNCFFALTPDAIRQLGNDIIAEDEFADLLGQTCVSLCAFRLRRNLHMVAGWPRRFLRACGAASAEQQSDIVREFKLDLDCHEYLCEQVCKSNTMKQVVRRSLFEKTSVMQVKECLQRTGFQWSRRLTELAESHVAGLVQTQIVEDVIGHQKNDKSTKARSRYHRPQASMCSALAAEVITERHKFRGVNADFAVKSKSDKLEAHHFHPTRARQSLDFHEIATTTAAPPFYSTKADNNNVVVADLCMLREYMKVKSPAVIDNAHLGVLVHFSHRIVLHFADDSDTTWWIGLINFPGSSCIVWPCRRMCVPGHRKHYFEIDVNCRDPVLKTIYELNGWQASTYVWRSWAWQKSQFGDSIARWDPAVRMFEDLGPMRPFRLASACAFWKLSSAQVTTLSKASGHDIDDSKPAFGILEEAVRLGMGCSTQMERWVLNRRPSSP